LKWQENGERSVRSEEFVVRSGKYKKGWESRKQISSTFNVTTSRGKESLFSGGKINNSIADLRLPNVNKTKNNLAERGDIEILKDVPYSLPEKGVLAAPDTDETFLTKDTMADVVD